MRHENRVVTSVSDLLTALKEQQVEKEVLWYRGQSNTAWSLMPSLARNAEWLTKERELIKRFIQLAVPHMIEEPPRNDWDWIFLMQHYRVPTRLLDWTESPLAALWFCVSSLSNQHVDGAIWCLSPLALNREARFRGTLETELPGFGKDDVLDGWLPDRQDQGLAQNPVAATGPRNSRRMAAQLGNFTIYDRGSLPIEEIGARQHLWKFIIPAANKSHILAELNLLKYTELTLFPDLDRVALATKELLQ